jgi:hypothetical protein
MAVKPVIDLITKIFGKKALSKTIGTRTNVITLPDSNIKTLIKNELDINKANDAQLEAFKKQAEQLIPEISKMNDQELLTFKGNLQRYYDRMYPPKAEVFDFQTKARVPKEGIEQLETQLGIPSDVDPNSPLGQIMTKTKQIEKQGKDLAKEFGMEDQLKKGLQDLMQEQKGMSKLYSEGLVRATVREIIDRDIKSGKIKLPEVEEDIVRFQTQGDPIDIFRKYYGEDALEQVDSITPKLRELRTSSEAADLATKEFTFEPKLDRPPGSYDPNDPPEFADGGRVGFANGGTTYDRYMANLAEIQSRPKADPLASLVVSPSPEMTDGDLESVGPTSNITRGNTTVQSRLGFADVMSLTNPMTLAANIASRLGTGRSLSENARRGINAVAAAMGFGGNAASNVGTAADPSTAASEDPSAIGSHGDGSGDSGAGAGGAAGAAAASAAGSNDGPDGGTFAEGGRVHSDIQKSGRQLNAGGGLAYLMGL